MTLAEVIDTLQTWISNADDEYDREEMGRVAGLKEALHEIKRIEPCEDCISREQAIKQCGFGMTHLLIANCLRRLPSVKPQDTKEIYNKGFEDGQKALEEHLKLCKEELLDKIRAEIEQNAYPIVHGVNSHEKGMTLYGILQIIDKYKAESEERE